MPGQPGKHFASDTSTNSQRPGLREASENANPLHSQAARVLMLPREAVSQWLRAPPSTVPGRVNARLCVGQMQREDPGLT